jgi:hypothetical protein
MIDLCIHYSLMGAINNLSKDKKIPTRKVEQFLYVRLRVDHEN